MDKSRILTLLGLVAGVLEQSNSVGLNFPKTRTDWVNTAFSVAIAALGVLAKGTDKKDK